MWKLKNIEIDGIIVGIYIRGNTVSYEVSYFLNNTFYRGSFIEEELIFEEVEKTPIGYRLN